MEPTTDPSMLGEFGMLLGFMAGISVGVWLLTNAIGSALPWEKIWTAISISIVAAVVLTGAGYMPNPTGAAVPWNYLASAVAGLLSAGGAKLINDNLPKKLGGG